VVPRPDHESAGGPQLLQCLKKRGYALKMPARLGECQANPERMVTFGVL